MLIPKAPRAARARQGGTSMIEVLVSIIIVVIGLLGLAGLQSHASLAEMESFQRAQALVLLQDMADRITANRKNSMAYANGEVYGTGQDLENCAAKLNIVDRDLCEWSNALLGAAESSGGGTKVGAMIGARGCVVNTAAAMPRQFQIAVVWQGLNPTAENNATQCGAGLYGDKLRRAVIANITIGCLQNDPASGLCVTP